MQNRISKIRNLLPNVPNLIKFGGHAQHNQQHERLEYFFSAAIPFKEIVTTVVELLSCLNIAAMPLVVQARPASGLSSYDE